MKYYGVSESSATLIETNYKADKLLLVSEKVFKETLALKVGEKAILMNEENVEYYTILATKGLSGLSLSAARTLFAPVGYAAVKTAMGGRKRKLVFVKFKNGKYALIQVYTGEGFLSAIKAKKVSYNKLSEKDSKFIQSIIDRLMGDDDEPEQSYDPYYYDIDDDDKEDLF